MGRTADALSAPRPVIASAVTGCVDAVLDGVTGILVRVRDSRALEEAMERYVEDEMLRARHGRAGRARVLRLFRREDLWRELHREYRRLLTSRGLVTTEESLTRDAIT